MPADFSWLQLYKGTYIELIAKFIIIFNFQDKIQEIAVSADPQQAGIQWGRDSDEIDIDEERRPYAIAAMKALLCSLTSIRFFGYPLNAIMAKYVESGDDQLLFKMLRVDRSILGHSRVMRRTAIAEAEGDVKFFKQLAKSITGTPHRKLLQYPGLRLCLVALHEDGGFNRLTENLAYDLFCLDLKIYPDEGDAGRSLWQFIQRWKKNYPT